MLVSPLTDRRPSPYAWLLPLMTLGLCAGIVIGRSAAHWMGGAAVVLASLIAALLMPGRWRCAALALAAAGLGVVVAWNANHPELPPEGEYVITGVVADEIILEEQRFVTLLDSVFLNGEAVGASAYWSAYLGEDETLPEWFRPGARVTFSGDVYHPGGEDNPGGYDFREYLLADGVTLGVYGMDDAALSQGGFHLMGCMASIRHRLAKALMDAMGEESGAMAAAMLLGTRDYIPEDDTKAFRELGIAHILSVSGYHVGVLALLLGMLVRPVKLPRWGQCALRAAVMALYVLLTGANAPVVRAALLLTLRDAGRLLRRQNLPLHLLCLAAVLQLLVWPMQLFGASFQLTYSAMLGILLVYPRLKKLLVFRQSWANWLWDGFAASIAAQLAILPAQLYWFCGFPLVTVFVNVFVIALTSLVMTLYWAMLPMLAIPGLREGFGALVGLITQGLLSGVRGLASVVGGSLWTPRANVLTLVGWAMLLLGMSILLRRKWRRIRRPLIVAGSLLVAVSLVRWPNTGTYWIQFSEGEADAALLHDQDTVVVIDAGEDGYALAGYLRQRRLGVDMLILTHLHSDHAGGIEALLDYGIPVSCCYLPANSTRASDIDPIVPALLQRLAETGTTFAELSRGDVLTTPHAALTALWPQRNSMRSGQSANDTCLVLRAEVWGASMLLAADLTSRYEMYSAEKADILKAAHHGSSESTAPEFLEAVSPEIILLSCGDAKREESLAARAGGIRTYSTHSVGAVTIRFAEGAYEVETCLPEE